MKLQRGGEDLWVLHGAPDGEAPIAARRLQAALCQLSAPGFAECSCGWTTVALYGDPALLGPWLDQNRAWLEEGAWLDDPVGGEAPDGRGPVLHEIPACYSLGPDYEEAAAAASIKPEQLVELHAGSAWPVRMAGFAPGFAYLGPLPEPLSLIPRRPVPRSRVAKGSVGIAAGQTGVYPAELPGGWMIVALCPLDLADPSADWFPIEPGDQAVFRPIDEEEYRSLLGARLGSRFGSRLGGQA